MLSSALSPRFHGYCQYFVVVSSSLGLLLSAASCCCCRRCQTLVIFVGGGVLSLSLLSAATSRRSLNSLVYIRLTMDATTMDPQHQAQNGPAEP